MVYLPTFTINIRHELNVGKCTIHESYGIFKHILPIFTTHNQLPPMAFWHFRRLAFQKITVRTCSCPGLGGLRLLDGIEKSQKAQAAKIQFGVKISAVATLLVGDDFEKASVFLLLFS